MLWCKGYIPKTELSLLLLLDALVLCISQFPKSTGLIISNIHNLQDCAQTTTAYVSLNTQLQAKGLKVHIQEPIHQHKFFESQSAPGFQFPYFFKCVIPIICPWATMTTPVLDFFSSLLSAMNHEELNQGISQRSWTRCPWFPLSNMTNI